MGRVYPSQRRKKELIINSKKEEIDDEVYRDLEKLARFGEGLNDVLRRLIKLGRLHEKTEVDGKKETLVSFALLSEKGDLNKMKEKKKSKRTRLDILVDENFLSKGQILYLHNHSGERISGPEFQATINGNHLLASDGKHYSMSALATKLLKMQGYSSDGVRGPALWQTENGESIMQIWSKYLNQESV